MADSRIHDELVARETEAMATADAFFDTVIAELRAIRDRYVEAKDHEALNRLAENLNSETF